MHKKGHKVSRKRTMRKHKGGYYGMSGSIAPGAALWSRHSEMGDWAVSSRGANAQYGSGKKGKRRGGMLFCEPDMSAPDSTTGKCADGSEPKSDAPVMGGKKRRMTKRNKVVKGKKGSRKMRGGNKYGGVSASFLGSGSRGLANHTAVSTRTGDSGPAFGAFNNFGAQPGSGFGSFIKAH